MEDGEGWGGLGSRIGRVGWQLQVTAMVSSGVHAGGRVLLICCERLVAATQMKAMVKRGGVMRLDAGIEKMHC